MLFTLEALNARHGDALLLHYGTAAAPRLVVIDGGPGGVWKRLRGRLDALRDSRAPDGDLPIRLVMVSHIDDDHIGGLLGLVRALRDPLAENRPSYRIDAFWHNAFEDVVRPPAAASASVAAVQALSQGEGPTVRGLDEQGRMVVASVAQGRQLRDAVNVLGIEVNAPFGALVVRDSPANPFQLEGGPSLAVIGPAQEQVDALQAEWEKQVERARERGASTQEMEAITAAYLDRSAYNLASIVVLAEAGGKRMLLTGDARGDHVLAGLEAQGALQPGGTMHVDLLKLPHHGSIRNVDRDFFERVTADHYVVSADGRHHNPDVETFELLTDVRGDAEYTLHLTNRVPAVSAFLEREGPRRRFHVVYRDEDAPSVRVELGEPLAD